MAGVPMELDANVLVNLAHYLDYDFISIGAVSYTHLGLRMAGADHQHSGVGGF